jgi:proteic killer suppression protein
MRIRGFRHKGLRLLFEEDSVRGLPTETVDKLRKMLAFLQDVSTVSEVRNVPVWKAHQLTGDRRGTWSLHVTRNWRLTFRIEDDEIVDVDFEDYH